MDAKCGEMSTEIINMSYNSNKNPPIDEYIQGQLQFTVCNGGTVLVAPTKTLIGGKPLNGKYNSSTNLAKLRRSANSFEFFVDAIAKKNNHNQFLLIIQQNVSVFGPTNRHSQH